jgi:hypothetical protein
MSREAEKRGGLVCLVGRSQWYKLTDITGSITPTFGTSVFKRMLEIAQAAERALVRANEWLFARGSCRRIVAPWARVCTMSKILDWTGGRAAANTSIRRSRAPSSLSLREIPSEKKEVHQ